MVFGCINNLWDVVCMFGGLVGGGVVVIVVGLISFDYGLEIGGFIRILVYYCGLYGYKLIWCLVFLVGYIFSVLGNFG